MNHSVFLIFMGILLGSSLSFAKVDPLKNVKTQDPNRQGLEESPSAISLLTNVIGPNLSPLEQVTGDRDKQELYLRSSQKGAKDATKGRSSTTTSE